MAKLNVIAVDLAKNTFQVCVFNKEDNVISNRDIQAKHFCTYLAKQALSLVAFEACARAQHWARKSQELGHEVIILPAKCCVVYWRSLVSRYPKVLVT